MKNLSLIVWITQLGMSVVAPPVLFILLAVWLRDVYDWGSWVLWVGIIIGVYSAFEGLRVCLKTMAHLTKDKKEQQPPAASYNDHD